MKKTLITGGTVFVSKYVAEYYVKKGYEVYVLNRNTKPQVDGTKLIEADRHNIGNKLKNIHFDAVIDVTAYDENDITDLLSALESFDDYVMISSSAVYPETEKQPFSEITPTGENKFWGRYGTDKTAAESALLSLVPRAYILRPPYLYGPMNNLYREAFVFDCALQDRKFCLPGDGDMKLQFYYIGDLCRFIDELLLHKPHEHIFNVGNRECVSIKDWVSLCYKAVGKTAEFISVTDKFSQRDFFCFYDYEYSLDTSLHDKILTETKDLFEGLKESFAWYSKNKGSVKKKEYLNFIDRFIADKTE